MSHDAFVSLVLLIMVTTTVSSWLTSTCSANNNNNSSSSSSSSNNNNEESALGRARALEAPIPKSQVSGEHEDFDWWESHHDLLMDARKEYGYLHPELLIGTGTGTGSADTLLDERFIISKELRDAVHQLWSDPSSPKKEDRVRGFCRETNVPGVYAFQLFTPEFTEMLLEEVDHQLKSGIPTRRPNGMNRYGAIMSDLALDGFVSDVLVDRYFRSLAQLLFPLSVGPNDADENYSFLVKYKQGEDVELSEHADASVVTVNVCLGKEGYQGGSLYFKGVRFPFGPDVDDDGASKQKEATELTPKMKPGEAIIHLGQHIHAAMPLTGGERINLIVWMFGQGGYVRIAPYSEKEAASFASQRWKILKSVTATLVR